jgi:hypothetical protein
VSALLRSELLKIRTTRTALTFALVLFGGIVFLALVMCFSQDTLVLAERRAQFQLLAVGSNAVFVSGLLGILLMAGEFRHGTIRPTFLAAPRRARVVSAKVVAATTTGLVLGIAGEALAFGLGVALLRARDVPLVLDGGDVSLAFAGTAAAAALWGAFGVGLGALVRSQVGAIVGLLVWALLVEGILFALVPGFARFLPGQASSAMTSVETAHALAPAAAAAVLAAYALVLAVAGAVVTARRDVP